MKYTNHFGLRDHSTNSEMSDWLSVVHRVVCTACVLVTVLCLLRCSLSFIGALQDARKFGGLGFSYPLYYYLSKNNFMEDAVLCLCVFVELLHYIFHYRRATELRALRCGIWCFAVMLVLHGGIYWHANFIVDSSTSVLASYYCAYANISLFPAAAYFTVYLLRVWDRW